jgi:hypothetical protein
MTLKMADRIRKKRYDTKGSAYEAIAGGATEEAELMEVN